jgi:low temperature requirement protein LtrA
MIVRLKPRAKERYLRPCFKYNKPSIDRLINVSTSLLNASAVELYGDPTNWCGRLSSACIVAVGYCSLFFFCKRHNYTTSSYSKYVAYKFWLKSNFVSLIIYIDKNINIYNKIIIFLKLLCNIFLYYMNLTR